MCRVGTVLPCPPSLIFSLVSTQDRWARQAVPTRRPIQAKSLRMRVLDTRNIRKILVRATNWIGDAVMTTPALGSIRSALPDAEIVLAANPVVAELMSPHPWCNRVIVYDKKGRHAGWRGLYRFSRGLAAERFDLAILFQNAIGAAIMARLAGIGTRAGYATDGRGPLLTHSVRVPKDLHRLHQVYYYLNMVNGLGLRTGAEKLCLELRDDEKDWGRRVLGPGKWAAINPGAAYGSAKKWYPQRFAGVADRLVSDYGYRIVVLGGPGETAICSEIESAMRAPVLKMAGKTSVRQMMAILGTVDLVVSNDSGPMHVAAAFDRPIVALFGPSLHMAAYPFCSRYRVVRREIECAPCLKRKCPKDHHRCMDEISVEDVIAAVNDLVGEIG